MAEFVLIVDFEVKDGMAEQVLALVSENARKSVETEPGCRQFDVLRVPHEPNHFMLYEVYEDEAAFKAHGETAHFNNFIAKARPMFAKTTRHQLVRATHPIKR